MNKLNIKWIVLLIFIGCDQKDTTLERVEDTFYFSHVTFKGYSDGDFVGDSDVSGSLRFSGNNIIMTVNDGTNIESETFPVFRVKRGELSNELIYKSPGVDFVIKLEGDKILKAALYSLNESTIFHKIEE